MSIHLFALSVSFFLSPVPRRPLWANSMARLGCGHSYRVRALRHSHFCSLLPLRAAQVPAGTSDAARGAQGGRTHCRGAEAKARGEQLRRLLGDATGGSERENLLATHLRISAHHPISAESAANRYLILAHVGLYDLQLLALLGRRVGPRLRVLFLRMG